MRIQIDIGHPHEVHFFKNFILDLEKQGHQILVSARNRSIIHYLLNTYNIKFVKRSKGSTNILGKILCLIQTDLFLYKLAKKFKPDIFLSFGSFYLSHIAKLTNKPSIIFNDTEHSKIVRLLYTPFCNNIITPESYLKNHKKKHIRFKGFKENSYLSKKYNKETHNIHKHLGINKNEKYIILRFISKNAFHDVFYKGFSKKDKIKLVNALSKKTRIFIDSEGSLLPELKKYKLNIKPELIHQVLNNACLFIGEGATMAAESALLGIPTIYNYMQFGYLKELEEHKLLKYFKNVDDIIKYSKKILNNDEELIKHKKKAEKLEKQCIDLTEFMKWIILKYPDSSKEMKENPNYQTKFINS